MNGATEVARQDRPPARPRPGRHRLSKRLRRGAKRFLVTVAEWTLPYLYVSYTWLVWHTSRVREFGATPTLTRPRYGRGVYALWHDEVFTCAYSFRLYRIHTLASRSDFGAIITRMLRLCNFQVFRGGSSSGRKRRATSVLRDMIECMNTEPGVVYGITVDGSNGPACRLKPGVISIAAECQAPLMTVRTWSRRYIRLPTWDGTIVPLPFNDIIHLYGGPYLPCPRDASLDQREAVRARLESELLELTYFARTVLDGRCPDSNPPHFPEGWKPAWEQDATNPEAVLSRHADVPLEDLRADP